MELYFRTREEWREWLSSNSARTEGIWIIYFKKGSGKVSITYNEALEEALCFGWIDSKIKRVNEEYYIQWFAPRRKGSRWSARNIEKVRSLIESGKMTPRGLAAFETLAEKPELAYTLNHEKDPAVPDDLLSVLKTGTKAYENFMNFPPSVRRNCLNWLASSKRDETRSRRILKILDLAEMNIKNAML